MPSVRQIRRQTSRLAWSTIGIGQFSGSSNNASSSRKLLSLGTSVNRFAGYVRTRMRASFAAIVTSRLVHVTTTVDNLAFLNTRLLALSFCGKQSASKSLDEEIRCRRVFAH